MKKLAKIDELLKTMGISEEARKEFIAVCESWHKAEKATLQEEYKARLDKAKTVCMEEVEAHKAGLSRGIKMFLESNSKSIRKASEKNAAIAESDAINTLSKVTKLLGGLNVDDAVNAQTLQAEGKKNAELTNKVADLQESLNREKAKSAKFSELSEKTIARQRNMETQLTESKKLLSEAHKTLTEKVQKTAKTISEKKTKSAKPQSTKKVVSESDKGKRSTSSVDSEMDLIAESVN